MKVEYGIMSIDACGTKYVEEADWMLHGYEINKED